MRRNDKAMSIAAARDLLGSAEYGILSTVGHDGEAYGVPLNYVLIGDTLYFHCALEGRKLDHLTGNDRVSFCVVGRTRVLPAEFSTEYESVIAAGRAAIVHGDERYRALLGLLEKYCPDHVDDGRLYIEKLDRQTCVVGIRVERITGKSKPVTM